MSKDKKGMDSMPRRLKIKAAEDTIRSIFSEISQRDKLAKELSRHVGVFDHASKTLSDVVKYGVKKIGLDCKRGEEHAMLKGWLQAKRSVASSVAVASDSSVFNKKKTIVDEFLKGGK